MAKINKKAKILKGLSFEDFVKDSYLEIKPDRKGLNIIFKGNYGQFILYISYLLKTLNEKENIAIEKILYYIRKFLIDLYE